MVEVPDRPTVRAVAGSAVSAEVSLVHVVRRVTARTFVIRAFERLRGMALGAITDDVHSEQREFCQVMVEVDVFLPGYKTMTRLTARGQLAAVHVIPAMAAGTIERKFLSRRRGGVTRVAIDICVCAHERKFRSGVIKAGGLPCLLAMAGGTLVAEPQGVGIIGAMASGAVARQRILQLARGMTARARNPSMRVRKREAGLPCMVELRGLPLDGRMAVRAGVAARAQVHIVGHMARHAVRGDSGVLAADMARIAGLFPVCVTQREGRFVVVESTTRPSRGAVAGPTFLTELTLMNVILPMAIAALGRGGAVRLPALMTAGAREPTMCAFQRKVGGVMVEQRCVELDDVRIAT